MKPELMIAMLESRVEELLGELEHCHRLMTEQIAQINKLRTESESKPAHA